MGIIFWSGTESLSSPETIIINSWAEAISCSERLQGIYYNNQRWRRIWPLDPSNLALLQAYDSSYSGMTITNGFYTSCTALSWWYVPLNNEVYGQIDHNVDGRTWSLFAGVRYDFTGNAIEIWTPFAHTLAIETWWVHNWYIFDTEWWIAWLNMNTPRCLYTEVNQLTGEYWYDLTFICHGDNGSGYIFSIFSGDDNSPRSSITVYTGISDYVINTWMLLATGDYTATCTVIFPDTISVNSCDDITFHIGLDTVVTNTGTLTGTLWFSGYNGSVVSYSGGNYYTNASWVLLTWSANQASNYILSGNFSQTPLTGTLTGTTLRSTGIVLSNLSSINNFSATYTTWSLSWYTVTGWIYIDTALPAAPIISTPTSGTFVCASTELVVNRSGSTDTWAGLSGYLYEISSNLGMTWIFLSGITTTGTASINAAIMSALAVGTYYIRVSAIDNVGNIATGDIVNFTTSQSYCTQWTGVMIVTSTIHLRNVDLDKVYRSDPIYIFGLTGPALVSVTKWMLFINNETGWATTGVVTSSDALYIELISSNEYDTTVSSYLQVVGLTGTFSLTTKKSNCVLSVGEKLVIENIYTDLKDEYDNDLSKLAEFLNTFQNMVEDESELSNSCTLEYLLELIQDEFDIEGIDTSNHITPNCKEYSIGYDPDQQAYYAPEMMQRYYFVNRESLIRHIDYYNPGDCHINTYTSNYRTQDSDPMRHTAPNGKIYHLIGQYGGFSAEEFATAKYFDSLQTIKTYIDLRNPAKEIWTHTVDTAFTPITYAAPNGKEYKIFKTNKWYMSYKLLRVKYYENLGDLKNLINVNNPSIR